MDCNSLLHIGDAALRDEERGGEQTVSDVDQLLTERIVETIARGAEARRTEGGRSLNLWIEHDGARAVLVKNPGSNSWLLTGFELRPDGRGVVFDTVSPTQSAPTVTRRGLGAGRPIVADDNSWLLTGFEMEPDGTERSATPTVPTQFTPIRSRREPGAGDPIFSEGSGADKPPALSRSTPKDVQTAVGQAAKARRDATLAGTWQRVVNATRWTG